MANKKKNNEIDMNEIKEIALSGWGSRGLRFENTNNSVEIFNANGKKVIYIKQLKNGTFNFSFYGEKENCLSFNEALCGLAQKKMAHLEYIYCFEFAHKDKKWWK